MRMKKRGASGAKAAGSGKRRGLGFHMTNKRRDALAGLFFFLPWLIGFFAITAYPLLYSLVISFNQVVITPGKTSFEPVGWEYFRQAFASDIEFPTKLMSSLSSVLLSTPITVVFALIISLLLNQKFRGRALYRMVFFLPVIIMSGPVMAELLTETSAMTIDINLFNVAGILQTRDSFWAGVLLTFLNSFVQILWFSGVQTIIFLAALQKVDRSLYEVAAIDGASVWESFWKITLPHLKPIILLNTIYTIVEIGTFSNDPTNEKIVEDMQDIGRPYSYAAAESWIYAFGLLLLMVVAFLLLNNWKEVRRARDEKRRQKHEQKQRRTRKA